MNILNYFDSFFLSDWLFLGLKLVYHIVAICLLFLLFKVIFIKLIKNKASFPIELLFCELYSAWAVFILYFLYFLFLIFINGVHFINFAVFSISVVNTYIILSPYFLSLSICAIFILHQNQKIKNILK